MKVVKFGGSSLASAEQLKKVLNIIKEDEQRRIVVVSAPGKRFKEDEKVTDLLIALAKAKLADEDTTYLLDKIILRYADMVKALEITEPVLQQIEENLQMLLSSVTEPSYFIDALKASGEDNNAKLVAAYFRKEGLDAIYINPKDAGLIVSDDPGNANVLESSYDSLKQLATRKEIVVFPGFFGYTKDGKVVTFSRGGSDITGAIVAKGVRALLYENFTDVDGICVANPAMVDNPKRLEYMTYHEMRELSYAGFGVFHDEALQPAFSEGIPVRVKNTNNPSAPGTLITTSVPSTTHVVTGIASMSGFTTIYVEKYLMNREIGFGRKLLQILEELHVSFEHMPSGIDDLTVLLRDNQLSPEKNAILLQRIKYELNVDEVYFNDPICLVMLVGEGMVESIGTLARAASAFARAEINVQMVNQGSSERSIVFGVSPEDEQLAVQALYEEFFG
ncbi:MULTISPECIES: aspartate kinase [unclassified Granulicatella]|uniref:aspartate kinase n=1 Tax=unclassified Granulicatella TaxID=2630493 RepID=UPI00107352CE|nr:aspartate kinase [Granulicatella sp. WM01]MBF0779619.1 aspartate kinase [Granulicatella sp. 19428wC4_WM01]TFU96418.1 aspartate kinase [Granulicatella sp. WM01]